MRSLVSKIETRWTNKNLEMLSVKKTMDYMRSRTASTYKKTSPAQNLQFISQLYINQNRKTDFKNREYPILLTKKDRAGLSYKYKGLFLGIRWRGVHTSVSLERRGFSYSDNVKEKLSLLSPSFLNLEKLNSAQERSSSTKN
jgi:hypothetical protein